MSSRRQNAHPKQNPPAKVRRQQHTDRPEGERRRGPAHRPAALHDARGLAAMTRLDGLGDQDRAHGPFAAEAEPLHGSSEQELAEGMREAAQKGERRKPQHRELQNAHSAIPIRQHAGGPAADGRGDERGARDIAGLRLAHAPKSEQRRNDEGVNHEVEAVQAIARVGGQQRSAFGRGSSLQPHSRSFPRGGYSAGSSTAMPSHAKALATANAAPMTKAVRHKCCPDR